jgi:hypothetical protein
MVLTLFIALHIREKPVLRTLNPHTKPRRDEPSPEEDDGKKSSQHHNDIHE